MISNNLSAGSVVTRNGLFSIVLETAANKIVVAPIGKKSGPLYRGDEVISSEKFGNALGKKPVVRCAKAAAHDQHGFQAIGQVCDDTLRRLRQAFRRAAESRRSEGGTNLPVSLLEAACISHGRRVGARGLAG